MTGVTGMKESVARAALAYVSEGAVVGVGTGSTAAAFVRALGSSGIAIAGAVPSSLATGRMLAAEGIRVIEPGTTCRIPLYVDGADEADPMLRLIKGGGGALTREKIVASMAERFVCIVDETKLVPALGAFPLPVEVLPAALARVECRLCALGGSPVLREGFISENGGLVLDVSGLDLSRPDEVESMLDGVAGVIACGLFARRPADVLLVGTATHGVRELIART